MASSSSCSVGMDENADNRVCRRLLVRRMVDWANVTRDVAVDELSFEPTSNTNDRRIVDPIEPVSFSPSCSRSKEASCSPIGASDDVDGKRRKDDPSSSGADFDLLGDAPRPETTTKTNNRRARIERCNKITRGKP